MVSQSEQLVTKQGLQAQTAETLQGIHSLGTLVPAIALGVVFLIIVFLYPLNKKRTKQLAVDLAERRNAAE